MEILHHVLHLILTVLVYLFMLDTHGDIAIIASYRGHQPSES